MFVSNLIKIFIIFLYNLFRRQIDAEFANPRLEYLRANSGYVSTVAQETLQPIVEELDAKPEFLRAL